ncbi:MAG: 2-isopropylmalate synthase [SAR324 cluster bacterium]|nr:2-isopropylmalate synthase [SAR324 cluster bacterium]
MSEIETIKIFDTTLRDGEQSPGFTMNAEEKLIMARQLAKMGVDTIEAGFAAASPGDFESVRDIGHTLKGPMVVSLCRTRIEDVDAAAEALKGSPNWGIHTFVAASPLHMKYKLQQDPEDVLQGAVKAVERSKSFTDNVEFSPEDATRSEPEFLVRMVSECIRAGATVINIPDTVGYTTPDEIYQLIDRLRNEVYQGDQVTFSVHCHNDRGYALTNAIDGFRAGAEIIDASVLGLGERAGIVDLAQLTVTLKNDFAVENNWVLSKLPELYHLISSYSGVAIPANFPIIGDNAFTHCAGVHSHAAVKNPAHYQSLDPQIVGRKMSVSLDHMSGLSSIDWALEKLSIDVNGPLKSQILEHVKSIGQKGRTVNLSELKHIVEWCKKIV